MASTSASRNQTETLSDSQLIWQDREIKFDQSTSVYKLRKGEFQIDSINSVEDTKGNNGDRGTLVATNMRLMWMSNKSSSCNLSIGLNTIMNLSIRQVQSKLKGNAQALYVMTKFKNNRFEFIFTSLVKNSPRMFVTVQAVQRAYETTRLYRDLKLRGAIIQDKELVMLPDEQLYDKVQGIWNLSSEQGNLGVLYITNIRLVWFAVLAENFNVSIPFVQIKTLSCRPSKFGQAMVVETSKHSGGFVLGFRADPAEKLLGIHTQISNMWKVHSDNPVFGVRFSTQEESKDLSEVTVARVEDDLGIEEEGFGVEFQTSLLYHADEDRKAEREPVYSSELGLAVEKLRGDARIEDLWKVLA